ncbi:YtxH domain-containing protein [Aridibaculum aurantiacum]|uniref:YtxH domain-containing protein n=1 Tax=Aridibaculum aurantiacum TaxID=2810307 RepID=UPI001A963BDE|nr:YtxH domain-containing protein [Aridibaculum aurantiacum]
MNSLSKTLLAFTAGALAGAAAGILLAPASGKETRELLADKCKVFESDFKELLSCCSEATAKNEKQEPEVETV